ncbi:flagellar basal body-associated FliL family protein [Bdellovibrio bacteriovorus]|uniref:Flagellar protein FliL n=1 Tax=Bdellovibrio bacteriovorus str. Tiberius TaxID=1069642 RepID=K7ZEP9_BDEBC|nr:flagellar basal body-associated FliL family protein [Bdellovibrio bacteriovorus]AFY00717.1 flagellar protein FliL [Bdellovibrio bacteriovorus str. Tiberius]
MAEAKETSAKPKNTAMLFQIMFAVLNLAVMGAGGYMVYASTMGWESPKITEEDVDRELASVSDEADLAPLVYTMDKFTVNLGGEPKRTIRLEINLQMLGKEGFEEVMEPENRAKARDRIVRLLNEKPFSDLDSIQGKLFLKDKIAGEVNGILRRGVVKDVFFSDFVVQ